MKTRISSLKSGVAPVVLGLALLAGPAYAQDTTEPGAGISSQDAVTDAEVAVDEGDEIVVTGTLIQNPNLESSSPVAVIGQDEVQLRQTNTAESILRDLPGVVPNLGNNTNNGTVGSARVDLRGLGSNRNIVLLDAARLVPSNFSGIVDLNNIPVALVDRVDVLTGGASTTYGADAVTGVVNFITKRDFAGIDLIASQQISEEGDTNVFRIDIAIGANFDDGRGNAVLAIGYQEADPLFFGKRDIGFAVVNSISGIAGGDSPTATPTSFARPTGNIQISPTGASLVPQYSLFNFNPFNIYVTPFERFNIFGKANYEINDTIEFYTRGLFSKNRVSSIIAPSGVFGESLTVPGQNPFLNSTIRNQLCTNAGIALGPTCDNNPAIPLGPVYRRTTEVGPRISEYVTTIFDIQAGFRLNFTDSLVFDAYGSYGESENEETRQNYVARSRLQQALNATNPNTCQVTTGSCVPLNLFGTPGSITPVQAGFIGGITSSITNFATLAQAHGVLSGDFGLTFASENPVSFAIGGEYRDYGAERRPDNIASVPGELGGAGGAVLPINGGFNVYEAFGELIAPIVSDRPGFHELTLEAGVRYSDYSVDAPNNPSFTATTYKGGVSYAPIEDIKFRGNYQKAVRAPNIGELFAPFVTGLTNLAADPCAGAAPTTNANLRAVCLAQGAPAGSIGVILNPAAGQANATGGGNPNLRPEKATTYTFGAVITPENFLSGLTITADYYNIKVTRAITAPTPGDVIGACFNNITAASATDPLCTGIRRSPDTGRLSGSSITTQGLPTPLSNRGRLKTDGIDLNINYRTEITDNVDLALGFQGNYTFSSQFQASPTGVNRDCVGFYSVNCGIATGNIQPEFSWNQRTTLSFDDIDVSLLWRHIDRVEYEGQAGDFAARGFTADTTVNGVVVRGNRNLFVGNITGVGPLAGRSVNFNRIKAFDYFDLTIRAGLTENLDLTVGVTNLLDKQPPILGGNAGTTTANGGNTFPSTYDVVGRRYAASARIKF